MLRDSTNGGRSLKQFFSHKVKQIGIEHYQRFHTL